MCTCGRRKASNEETSLWFKESLGMEFEEAVKLLTWAQALCWTDPNKGCPNEPLASSLDFPHKCPRCNQAAYVGFTSVTHAHGGGCS